MKLKRTGSNQTVVSLNNGAEVFFSYDTPVAGYSDKLGFVKTNKWYSQTTTRHINKYLRESTLNLDKVKEVDQSVINDLLKEQIPTRY